MQKSRSLEREDVQTNVKEMQARLGRLERQEWWRWVLAFAVMLALTAGVFAVSIPVSRNYLDEMQLSVGLRGLLGLVLLFDVFVVHQQVQMKKLRRELGEQVGLIMALESMHEADEAENPRVERRRARRSGLDRRLCVNSLYDGKPSSVYGRIRDISEDGLGAVIPTSLRIGEEVTLQFAVENYQESDVKAVVRHRKSFHYGFEFVNVDANLRRAIAKFVSDTALARV